MSLKKLYQRLFNWSGQKLNKLNGGLKNNKYGLPNKKKVKK